MMARSKSGKRWCCEALQRFGRLETSAAALVILLVACGPGHPRHRTVVGASGTEWKLLSQKPMTTRDGRKAFRFRFQTEIDFDDSEALHAEAEAFLADHTSVLEAGGHSVALVVSATPITNGWAGTRDEYRFRFEREPTGTWKLTRKTRVDGVAAKQQVRAH